MSCKVKDRLIENDKDYILYLGIYSMELLDLLDLEKARKKVSPYLPVFIFGLLFFIDKTFWNFIWLFASLLSTAIFWIMKEDITVKRMAFLLHSNSKEKKKVAKLIGEEKIKSFLFKAVLSLLQFVLLFISMSVALLNTFKDFDNLWFSIIWLSLAILSTISVLYMIIHISSIDSNIKNTVNLVKGRT